jgi:hypothetical protein
MTECEAPAKWHLRRSGGLGSGPRATSRCFVGRCVAGDTWGRSNGLRPGQRPRGRRYSVPVSWGFPRLGPAAGGCPGARSGTRPRFRRSQGWHLIGPRWSECSNYASDLRLRQDSSLRTRLRRGLLCMALTRQRRLTYATGKRESAPAVTPPRSRPACEPGSAASTTRGGISFRQSRQRLSATPQRPRGAGHAGAGGAPAWARRRAGRAGLPAAVTNGHCRPSLLPWILIWGTAGTCDRQQRRNR